MIGQELASAGPSVPSTSAGRSTQPWQRLYSEPFGLSQSTETPTGIRFEFLTPTVPPLTAVSTTTSDHQGLATRTARELQESSIRQLLVRATTTSESQRLAFRIITAFRPPTNPLLIGSTTPSERQRPTPRPGQPEVGASARLSGALFYAEVSRLLGGDRPTHRPAGGSVTETPGVPKTPYLSLVWRWVERQQLGSARRLLMSLPDEPDLQRVRRLLNPPETSISARRRSANRSADYAWLSRHAHDYAGQWVAVLGGSLIAAEPTLQTLRQRLSELSLPSAPLLHHVE